MREQNDWSRCGAIGQVTHQNSSLLQKEGSAFRDKQRLEALARSKMYRDYERTFTEATSDLQKFSLRGTIRSEFADFLKRAASKP